MKVRTSQKVVSANRIFTDRMIPRSAFWKKYQSCQASLPYDDQVHVLTYYGIGGIGKTRLLKQLMKEMDEQAAETAYIHCDLGVCHESRNALTSLKNKLIDKYSMTFPLFELGLYIYSKKIGENTDPLEVDQIIDKSPFLKIVLELIGTIPVAGFATTILGLADQCIAYIRTHLKNHSKEIKQIEHMEPEELYSLLPYLFALDMACNQAKRKKLLVVFFDTYESVVNELSGIGEPLNNDLWIRGTYGLIQNIPHVLWVIAGREKLKWDLLDPDWNDSLEQHLLGNLSFSDCEYFLECSSVGGSTLRKQIFELTNGTPVYLDLCVDQYERLSSKGVIPDISQFGQNTYNLVERFIRYMSDSQKDLIYLLGCMGKWNDVLIANNASSILPNFSLSAYEKIKSFSFVISLDDFWYRIHPTIEKIIIDHCPNSIKTQLSKKVIQIFSNQIQDQNPRSLEYTLSLEYILRCGIILHKDRTELLNFYKQYVKPYLFKLVHTGQFEYTNNIFGLLWDEAQRKPGDAMYAVALSCKASLQFIYGYDANECKKIAEEALELHQALFTDNSLDTLDAIYNLAVILHRTGDHPKMLKLFHYVLLSREAQLGEDHIDTISAMSKLADSYRLVGQHNTAINLQRKVLSKLLLILGDNHPDTAQAMNNLANSLRLAGENQEAIDLLNKALTIYRNTLGNDHPYTIRLTHNLAIHLKNYGDLSRAVTLAEWTLNKSCEILGEDHPDTIIMKNNLRIMNAHNDLNCEVISLKDPNYIQYSKNNFRSST